MFTFATVALLGLAVTKVVDLVRYVTELDRSIRIALSFVLGTVLTWVADYSMFTAWGITFREAWMGPVATGLVIGGLAAAWHGLLGVLTSYARRSHDQATEIESRRAA